MVDAVHELWIGSCRRSLDWRRPVGLQGLVPRVLQPCAQRDQEIKVRTLFERAIVLGTTVRSCVRGCSVCSTARSAERMASGDGLRALRPADFHFGCAGAKLDL